MRIAPLHNIREPGLIPNGFQKEEASPPAPDPRMQPELRNRAEAQSDTRHVYEMLNPRARLETNAGNRTNSTFPPKIEMGRERQQKPTGAQENQAKPVEINNDAYERLLRILLGQKPSEQASLSQTDKAETVQNTAKPLEMETHTNPPRPGVEAYNQAANLGTLVSNQNSTVPERELPRQEGTLNYYQRKAIQAYRTIQSFAPQSNILHQA